MITGIDIGGTQIKGIAMQPDGTRLADTVGPTRYEKVEGRPDWLDGVGRVVKELESLAGEPAERIGISAPGIAAPDGSCIISMPGKLKGLEQLDWQQALGFGRPIPVLNDAQAALLSEVWLGAAKGLKHVLMITLGTGVGGAAIIDGRLLRGATGRAGHVGHVSVDFRGPPDICNAPGSIELAIGNGTIKQRSGGRFKMTRDLLTAMDAGDAEAKTIWLDSVQALAAGIASLGNILDPEVVVIGGGISAAGDALFDPLEEFLDRFEWRPLGHQMKIVPAQLGNLAGSIGAAYNTIRNAS